MKSFLGTFLACAVGIVVFLFFGGAMLLQSFWGIVVIAALFLSILCSAIYSLTVRVEELEKKLKELEKE